MLYSGAAIVLGLNHFFSFFQLSSSGAPLANGKPQVKIMSYNVRLFDLYNWDKNIENRNKIFELLKKEDPDIICFQEFFYRGVPGAFETRDTMIQFLKAKNYFEGYTHKLIQKQYFGLATFSAYPIIKGGKIDFPNDANNNAIYTDIKIKEDTVRVYNVHLSSIRFQRADYAYLGDTTLPKTKGGKDVEQKILSRIKNAFIKRVAQTQIVLKHVSNSPYPVIIAGDFNDTPVSYCYDQFTDALNDAFIVSGTGLGSTYAGMFPGLRIDYILHGDELHSWGFQTIYEKLSDHYPVQCWFQLK